jgi:hypothetical protein
MEFKAIFMKLEWQNNIPIIYLFIYLFRGNIPGLEPGILCSMEDATATLFRFIMIAQKVGTIE